MSLHLIFAGLPHTNAHTHTHIFIDKLLLFEWSHMKRSTSSMEMHSQEKFIEKCFQKQGATNKLNIEASNIISVMNRLLIIDFIIWMNGWLITDIDSCFGSSLLRKKCLV